MRTLLRLQIWIASLLALFACIYVRYYNAVGLLGLRKSTVPIVDALDNLQWIVFVVPLCGVLIALICGRSRHLGLPLFVAEVLYIFAVVWPLIAIFVWNVQESGNNIIDSVGGVR